MPNSAASTSIFFYFGTLLDRLEYVRIRFNEIPQEFIDEYNLEKFVYNGWIYFDIFKGVYGLPQAGKLANNLLKKSLKKHGYYKTATTPGLWRHQWQPIMFTLIVDHFWVE